MSQGDFEVELKINDELSEEERLQNLFCVFDFLLGEIEVAEKKMPLDVDDGGTLLADNTNTINSEQKYY